MKEEINVLILSSGTRNKIVQYFRNELKDKGKVYTTDCSKLAPSLYDSDGHFIVSRISEKGYLDEILDICQKGNITGVLSLIDPELSILAKNKEKFIEIGTIPIISDYEIVELCFDKYEFNEYLKENGFNWIKSYIDKELFFSDLDKGEIEFPVFVKPVRGSASINISKVTTKEEVNLLFNQSDNLMIQEFMDGTEYGVDVYIDILTKNPVSIFSKEKISMRAGETDKSKSVKDDRLFELIKRFVTKMGFNGIIDIDIFKVGEEYYISEVNPRFGGGYPHAHETGVNVAKQIIFNLSNKVNIPHIGHYSANTYMMKYNEVKIVGN